MKKYFFCSLSFFFLLFLMSCATQQKYLVTRQASDIDGYTKKTYQYQAHPGTFYSNSGYEINRTLFFTKKALEKTNLSHALDLFLTNGFSKLTDYIKGSPEIEDRYLNFFEGLKKFNKGELSVAQNIFGSFEDSPLSYLRDLLLVDIAYEYLSSWDKKSYKRHFIQKYQNLYNQYSSVQDFDKIIEKRIRIVKYKL